MASSIVEKGRTGELCWWFDLKLDSKGGGGERWLVCSVDSQQRDGRGVGLQNTLWWGGGEGGASSRVEEQHATVWLPPEVAFLVGVVGVRG